MTAPAPARANIPLSLADRLERAWPVSLFFNAVFHKEMRAAGHRSGTYLARSIYGALMLGIVAVALIGMLLEGQDTAADAQQLQALAPIMAIVLAWFGLFMLAFIAPVMTVPAFMDERRRRTLPVLITTPLTSAQIVCAKLASQTIQLLILALMGLPVVLALRIFGGVPASFLLKSNAVLLSAALLVSTLGLRFSLHRQRADVAIVGAFVTAALIQFGPLLLVAAAAWAGAGPRVLYIMPVTCSPITLATLTAELMEGAGGPPWAGMSVWLWHTLYNLAWALAFVLITIIRFRRVLRLEGAGINYLRPRKQLRRARTAARLSAAPADRSAGAPHAAEPLRPPPPGERDTREVGDRPVLWRELRQATFRTRTGAILTTLAIAVFLVLLYLRVGLAEQSLHMIIGIVMMLFILLRAAAGSTAAFTSERESRTLETLLTTPLSAREIVWGKFLGAMRRQWYAPAVLYAHLLIGTAADALNPSILLLAPLTILPAVAFLSATGLFFGLAIRRATTASITNICTGLFLWAGTPGFFIMLTEFFGLGRSTDWRPVQVLLFFINPLGQLISALEAASNPYNSGLEFGSPGMGTFDLFHFTLYILAAGAGYGLVAWAALLASSRLFKTFAGRNS